MPYKSPKGRIMSSLAPHPKVKFLLDENVKRELYEFIKFKDFDVILAPKELSNGKLAEMSKSEGRVLISNDSHFSDPEMFPREKIFGVIWLIVSQDKPKSLLESFSKLVKDKFSEDDFKGKLYILSEGGFEINEL